MPFLDAISGANKIKVRGDSSTAPVYNWKSFLSINPNNNVYTARINQATFLTPLAELTYDNGAGTLANVRPGMLVLIASTNDRTAAFFRGRVRKTPTATVLYINQTGAAFSNNDFIFIIDDYPIMAKWPREEAGILKADWDIDWRAPLPLIYDLKGAYVDFVDTGTSVITISFAPTVVAAASGAAITTHLWDVDDGTITVGSTATQNITATFPAGFRWVHYTATDDNGNAQIRHIPVWAHDTSSEAPTPLEFGGLSIEADLPTSLTEGAGSGYNATVTAFDQVDTILDNTLVVGWFVESYNGAAGSIVDNIGIVGRFRNEANITAYLDEGQRDDSVKFDIEGVLTQMETQRVPTLNILDNDSASAFNDITDLTLWRAVSFFLSEYSTFASLYSLEFDSTSDDFSWIGFATVGDNILATVSDLATRINAVLQQNPNGSCEVVRRAVMLDSAGRSALTTVLDLTVEDLLGVESYTRDYVNPIGSLFGDGGAYDTTNETFTAYDVRAPGGAADAGSQDGALRRQLLIANQTAAQEKTELTERAGHGLAAQQNVDALTVNLLDGWRWLIPAVDQWYTWTLGARETTRGIVLTTATNWWLQAMSITPQENTIDVTGTFLKETTGDPGQIIIWPVLETGTFPLGLGAFAIQDFTLPPPSMSTTANIDLTASNGGFNADTGTYVGAQGWTPDCVGGTSEFMDINLDLGGSKTLKSITTTYDSVPGPNVANLNIVYTKVSGGSWTIRDIWTTGSGSGLTNVTTLNGIAADAIRLVIYAGGSDCTGTLTLTNVSYETVQESESWTHTFDFTANNGGFSNESISFWSPSSAGSWGGSGWTSEDVEFAGAPFSNAHKVVVQRAFSSTIITSIALTTTLNVADTFSGAIIYTPPFGAAQNAATQLASTNPLSVGSNTTIWTGSQAMTAIGIETETSNGGDDAGGGNVVTQMIVTGTGTNPFI